MIILIHSSKTMKPTTPKGIKLSEPTLIMQAMEIYKYLGSLNLGQIQKIMGVSEKLAIDIKTLIKNWPSAPKGAAMYSFRGDVYSGLGADEFSQADIKFASNHLRIVSGLYGILKPLDAISTYRLEMGYRFPSKKFQNLYKYWDSLPADDLPKEKTIINLTSTEYAKAVLPYLKNRRIITPCFYTYNNKTGKNTTVAVHSKIARGALAGWLIKNHIANEKRLSDFTELGYRHDKKLSKDFAPAYVCKEFGGKGLSVRLK